MVLNYSGVNFDNFSLPKKNRLELFEELKSTYPSLEVINPKKPTYLFFGKKLAIIAVEA